VAAAGAASVPTAQPPADAPAAEPSRRRNLSQSTKALVLQGGGALGAYQAGAFEVLHAQYQELDWVAGVSIGAINGALIAGNPPERRVAALREFWRTVSSAPGQLMPRWGGDEQLLAQASAGSAVAFGIPGLFAPTLSPLWLFGFNAPLTGVYSTEPMRDTLLRLVDFERLNRGDVRFSVGAVNVRTGNSTYFDNHQQVIGPEHIMASAALPPGFPAVHIDGEDYWDGGVVSNTPLQHVLDNQTRDQALVVMQIDLFSAQGQLPTTLGEVIARQKDIQYSSRTRMNSTNLETQINLGEQLASVLRRLPPEMQQDPEVQALRQHLQRKPVDIVHLIYRSHRPFAAADFEFSRTAVDTHWQAGAHDMTNTLRHPDLLRAAHAQGVTTYDLTDEANPRVRHRLNAELV
jgi:NTE family protein